jgi:hypothetical protein
MVGSPEAICGPHDGANALGLTVRPALLATAYEVIELNICLVAARACEAQERSLNNVEGHFEINPKMIEAGAKAILGCLGGCDGVAGEIPARALAGEVYRAMASLGKEWRF